MKELTLKELQNVSLDILKDVHKFCENNNIRYSIFYGTLIGAIRHKGFIPWDDDIDIVLPRNDFEQLCNTYTSPNGYKLIKPKDSYLAYARIYDTEQTSIVTVEPDAPEEFGVKIDVFPLDGVSENKKEFLKQVHEIKKLRLAQLRFRISKKPIKTIWAQDISVAEKMKRIIKKLIYHGKIHEIIAKHQQLMRQYDFEKARFWGQLSCPANICDEYHRKEDFSHTIPLSFEGETFYAMNGYDRVLREIYGDYMQLPPIEKQKPKITTTKFYWKTK